MIIYTRNISFGEPFHILNEAIAAAATSTVPEER
jgi:hypothetical protein